MSEQLIINKIEQQKKNKMRFNIFINEEYAFSVHEDILISHKLYKGMEIDNNYYSEIIYAEEKNKCWQKSLRYLSYKSRTESEVKQYLLKNAYEDELSEEVITKLKEKQFLNDDLYAKNFIEQRIKSNPKGKKMLAYELKCKGISSDIITKSLHKVNVDKEFDLACLLVAKRIERYRNAEWFKAKQKLAGYLQRRGFSLDAINLTLEHFKNYFED